MRPATCVAGDDWTFAASLMKAVAECHVEQEAVLLCVYDALMPPPLNAARSVTSVFGVALVLTPAGDGPRITLQWDAEAPRLTEPLHEPFRLLARSNPAARSLRLLEALARGGAHEFDMAYMDGRLRVCVAA